MTSPSSLLLVFTTLITCLIAGLFFAWSVSVIPGINQLPDGEYLRAMQVMNRAIFNPLFFFCFLGAAAALQLCAGIFFGRIPSLRFWFLVGAATLYIFGVIGITIGGNVPLNEALDSFQVDGASAERLARQRLDFEMPWRSFHAIRTVASVIAALLMIMACRVSDHE